MANPTELDAMRQAIVLSAHGLGTTSPNPPVGCVILDRDGIVAGHGYHERDGEAHAEANALAGAGARAEGGTAVVTLEPCNHHGRTPACRQALIDARVARVVVATIDPSSQEEGGAARLRAAGIDVEVGVLADEADEVIGPWLTAMARRRPHVTWANVDDGSRVALRRRHDLVVSADGSVEEGFRGGHAPGALDLGGLGALELSAAGLDALFAWGARTVLVTGPAPDHDLVDAVILDVALANATGPDAGPPPLPPGFAITAIERRGAGVRVHVAR